MKLAIVSDDGISVADHFGHARGVLLVDLDDDGATRTRFVSAGGDLHDQREEGGPLFAPTGPLAGCQALLCGGMGAHAYESIEALGIEPILVGAGAGAWQGVVAAYRDGSLARHRPHACCHGH